MQTHLIAVCCALLTLGANSLRAQDPEEEESANFLPGLALTVDEQSPVAVPDVSFQQQSARKPGASALQWKGFIESQAPGEYRFAVMLCGQLKLEVGGKRVLDVATDSLEWVSSDPIYLDFDQHSITVALTADKDLAASIRLFWSGPNFRFEPIPAGSLLRQRSTAQLPAPHDDIAMLRGLRCEACHDVGDLPAVPSPSLQKARGNLRTDWLKSYLTRPLQGRSEQPWRRFHQRFRAADAADLSEFVFRQSDEVSGSRDVTGEVDLNLVEAGRYAVMSRGCLACHRLGEFGSAGPLSGSDLTDIAAKRPISFFSQWLQDPKSLNVDHRMPRYDLGAEESSQIGHYLATLGSHNGEQPRGRFGNAARGEVLFRENRCYACHRTNTLFPDAAQRTPLSAQSDWERSCLNSASAEQPDYGVADSAARERIQEAVERYARQQDELTLTEAILAEKNCFGCHQRGAAPGILPIVESAVVLHARFAERLPDFVPPSLNSVGDKLHAKALLGAIQRTDKALRPWLEVQMPKFDLNSTEVDRIRHYFAHLDRVPSDSIEVQQPLEDDLPMAGRLVTSDGFGCTSCHAVGKLKPQKAPRGGLAPSLSMLGKRIRRVWFERWVRNPARIVPRMEMPSVQIAVPNALGGDLDRQLSGVWAILNQRGFQPPDPSPVRIVGQKADRAEHAAVLTDVFKHNGKVYVRPLVLGLTNRQNVLFDLATCRLVAWWSGDTALQRTQGKTWFWESPGLFPPDPVAMTPDIALVRNGKAIQPSSKGQFVTVADDWRPVQGGVRFRHRLQFAFPESDSMLTLKVSQTVLPDGDDWKRYITATGLESGDQLSVRLTGASEEDQSGAEERTVDADPQGAASLAIHYPAAPPRPTLSSVPVEPSGKAKSKELIGLVPGFHVTRLPLPAEAMPIALAWTQDGQILFSSLKGRVWRGRDTNQDAIEDEFSPISNELAAPYGIHATDDYIDVVNKYGIIRLTDEDGDGAIDEHAIVASGWGHTDDYHDWVVGLPVDDQGNYYVAIPCQQDDRTPVAAHLRGRVLRLTPRQPTDHDPMLYQLEVVSAGHRFPMGIARNRQGLIFVTDNQGNYNPYNELNHVRDNAHFGFINRLEKSPGHRPALTPPAINIPHPWTRSVNGICFLESPAGQNVFGPYEGHLVGCEYDTRRLVRMSVEQVDGVMQGAVYPLSDPSLSGDNTFLGPIAAAVSPDGKLYVGCIRDSGWGGANNTGSLVRIQPQFASLPTGIAEVRCEKDGFVVAFTRSVDRRLAADRANYTIHSATRISTPAYGGEDVDRREEVITDLQVADDGRSVRLTLAEVRSDFVYEFRLKNVAGPGQTFFPSEAFYTLHRKR